MGERKRKPKDVVAVKQAVDDVANHGTPMSVVTPGGRIQVRWDTKSNATAMGQLAFFAEFLEVAGLFERWVQQCPLHYSSPNAPKVRDVLGTWLFRFLTDTAVMRTLRACAATRSRRRYWEWTISSATKACGARWRTSLRLPRRSTVTSSERRRKRNCSWPSNGWIKPCWKAYSMP